MPNHVENILKIKGTKEEIKEVKDFLKGKYNDETERNIDFNNITPMPKWVYRGDLSSREMEKYGKKIVGMDGAIKIGEPNGMHMKANTKIQKTR